jgi:hypothetical protein
MSKRVRRIIPAASLLVAIHLQHLLPPVRVMLERRQRFDQPLAPSMHNQFWQNSHRRISELFPYFRPPIYSVHVGRPQPDTFTRILR